jgi:hypothetical protein
MPRILVIFDSISASNTEIGVSSTGATQCLDQDHQAEVSCIQSSFKGRASIGNWLRHNGFFVIAATAIDSYRIWLIKIIDIGCICWRYSYWIWLIEIIDVRGICWRHSYRIWSRIYRIWRCIYNRRRRIYNRRRRIYNRRRIIVVVVIAATKA